VVFDFSKYMHRVLEIDPGGRRARVQSGASLDALRGRAAPHHLTFGPDPATHQYCTLGGMIGNNSCGVHSVMSAFYGPGPTTADNVQSLEVLTYDGTRMRVGATDDSEYAAIVGRGGRQAEIYRQLRQFVARHATLIRREYPDIFRRVSGFNLPALLPENGFHVGRALVGSESTLAITLEATVTLLPMRPCRVLAVLGYPSVYEAADHVPHILRFRPVGLEGMDDLLVRDLKAIGVSREHTDLLPDGAGWLLVEFGGNSRDEALEQARRLVSDLEKHRDAPACRIIDDPSRQATIWELRESGLAATAHVTGESPTWPGWEDSSVPPERLGTYLRELRALFDKFDYHADLYGHFGQGCVHCRIDFDFTTDHGVRTFRALMEEAADLVVRHGGSLSGEHGDGQARGELLDRMFSPGLLQASREFKSIWDPDWRMNPGKVIDANPLDADLRLRQGADLRAPLTWFRFPGDDGDFGRATQRCVGVGKCRKQDAGTMCPSYMVTREEKHSTRGRARMLFEMLQGDPLKDGWRNEHVKEALDLCLACKGCKGECPVSVDMATYKSEFLAHYFEHRRRPRSAYAFGMIDRWAALAEIAPRLANAATQTPGLRAIAKLAAGMASERRVPAFAPSTFRERFRHRTAARGSDAPRVVLWPDTFNDHFHPETLLSAVEVLEACGFRVELPRAPVCCGRPLYDYGFLDDAKRYLEATVQSLTAEIEGGVPIVVLEPSCAAVFHDELQNLMPDDDRAKRLGKQVVSLGALLAAHAGRVPPMKLRRKAVVHGHCHQKALTGLEPEKSVIEHLGLDCEELDSGCCGMAGSFGFERDHCGVSIAVGERALLPRIRTAARDTLVIADGFSCREQIAQLTDRRALHLADVLRMALSSGPLGPAGDLPERTIVEDYSNEVAISGRTAAVLAAAGAAAVWLARRFTCRRGSGEAPYADRTAAADTQGSR
jgi:FAD/FMN-containing dehydrogenase/Fe-S oxidoreductase